MDYEACRIINAAAMSAGARADWMSSDRIEALTAGHGMLNMAVFAITNVVAEELLRGQDVRVKFANARRQPIDDIIAKAIDAARSGGADGANAALLTATCLYLVGAPAQVGVPAGNRKLGATARMIAGVDRCGIAAVPTGKMSNKISGFPAVLAVNQAMIEGRLSPVSGRRLPLNVRGGPLVGHSALGEDLIFPAMAENGARIGTLAMLDALAGAAMPVHPFTAALFGAAAILEIIHPDADLTVPDEPGGIVSSATVAGRSAATTAGLPELLHVRTSGEEYETGRLVGDLALILKDVGGVSVIGMMMFNEMMAIFSEGIAGSSGGPLNPPLGHICADAVLALKGLVAREGDQDAVARDIVASRDATSVDPEIALCALNTVARKACEVRNGPVTETLIRATEPIRIDACYRRAAQTYEALQAGRSLADVVRELDEERQAKVEAHVSAMWSESLGKDIDIHVTRITGGARREGPLVERYLAFDCLADVDLTVDGELIRLPGVVHELLTQVALGEREDIAWCIPMVATVILEFFVAGNTIINITVPAAVAAAMGVMEPVEAARTAERAAYLTASIPGGRQRAEEVARMAADSIARGGG